MGEWVDYSYSHIGDMKESLMYVDVDISEYDNRFWTWNQDVIRMEIVALEDGMEAHRIYVDALEVATVLFNGDRWSDTVVRREDVTGLIYDVLNEQYVDFCELWEVVYIKGGV